MQQNLKSNAHRHFPPVTHLNTTSAMSLSKSPIIACKEQNSDNSRNFLLSLICSGYSLLKTCSMVKNNLSSGPRYNELSCISGISRSLLSDSKDNFSFLPLFHHNASCLPQNNW